MNDWDRNNLNFLLTASPEVMQQWHDHADQDDYNYAMELLQAAQTELELMALDQIETEVGEDLSAAQAVLSGFRL